MYPVPPNPTLQDRVSLTQVASEDKVALFHIGRHTGETAEQLVAPSLRQLIESPNIRMTGQSIMGDCARLKEHFGLDPHALSELSYFHILLDEDPGSSMFTRYAHRGLQFLVETYFPGLTLHKDPNMYGEWTRPLSKE
ncbi:hypothetical protein K458DRAFT_461040 [Lentithecium fluviatile CBS 122367]|uniref:3'-5' exonuclease domain-containing protein n=1 Tax=Lentithecium fluviatile CBS 122367 TaxID=1168545 RepID=A0A6G1IN35_9PLEO|nr:hypothetical protein K458DRAFT_461040 [Lentithecium fluviatile CBS 122367]